jgi:hypothetical protein
MAVVKAPFLSMSARGQVGKTLVSFNWKGLNVMRSHVVPANPETEAQTTHRTLWSDMVYAWRNFFTSATERTAWNLAALNSANPQSGFNVAMAAMVRICADNPDASFAYEAAPKTGQTIEITMKNADDGEAGDETGEFQIWCGSSPGSLLNVGPVEIDTGVISSSKLGETGEVKYVQIRKDDEPRSGIEKIKLEA